MQVHLVSDGGWQRRTRRCHPALLGVDSPSTPFFYPQFLPTGRPVQSALSSAHLVNAFPSSMSLRIIATGGTFDKQYDPLTGQLVFGDSVIPSALARARITVPCQFEPLMAIDSLDMLDSHRQQILAACERSNERHIVVVHGTDTLRETAMVLGQAKLPKTIVLTGAMVPYRIDESDALFNLGFACAAATLCEPGVHVAMNAQVFPWHAVHKNRSAGVFEAQ